MRARHAGKSYKWTTRLIVDDTRHCYVVWVWSYTNFVHSAQYAPLSSPCVEVNAPQPCRPLRSHSMVSRRNQPPSGKKWVRSTAGYANQRRCGHARAASTIAHHLAPYRPTYSRLSAPYSWHWHPLVAKPFSETAFERFQGWVIRTLLSPPPGSEFPTTYSQARRPPFASALNPSNYGYTSEEFTSHEGPQHFKFCGAPHVLPQPYL